MSVFHQLSARPELNVTDITDALKAGHLTPEQAAGLLDHVKMESPVTRRQREAERRGQLSMLDEAWLEATPKNSYEGLSDELSEPQYREMYYRIMELRGFE